MKTNNLALIHLRKLNNQEIRAIMERYWEATMAHDLERLHEYYHDDVVVEFPQSGERIRGKQNIYELRTHYPTKVTYKMLRVRGDGNLWTTEVIVTYDNDKDVQSMGWPSWSSGMIKSHMKHSILHIHLNHLSGDLSG